MKDSDRSCIDCKHYGAWSRGGSYYEPPDYGWECEVAEEEIQDLIEKADIKAATDCRRFEEKTFDQCPVCHKDVNQSLRNWEIFSSAWDCDPFPVCSEECGQKDSHDAQKAAREICR